MKILLLAVSIFAGSSAFAAKKARFSVFKQNGTVFAEATCTGIPSAPNGVTLRLPAVDGSTDSFELYAGNLVEPWQLVIDASNKADVYTLIVMAARVDSQPIWASTYSLDTGLHIGSGINVNCEMNAGARKTKP